MVRGVLAKGIECHSGNQQTKTGFKIRTTDREDGVQIKVSKASWDKKNRIAFETRVPSSKYQTRNVLTFIFKNKMRQGLTLVDLWQRI